ncbi:hypothetical protein B0H15DRAFT_796037 [Mycena belliarum]|uniref:Ubiquitin-like protease family profile domain-containing protein n=1 Tax=Mycena belliarum TaxID=1033014 RepID=A0AAD6XZ09_9AGAR|nr:hypothetical protein B0H15DRAFT_796037 [Mycena belliae]
MAKWCQIYPEPSLRLPLFALRFFRKIHKHTDGQEKWANSMDWTRDELPGWSLDIFASVSWNTVHSRAPDGQLDWTRLVDDEWLSGGIIDNMMADIHSRVVANPALSSIIVAPLSFQAAILAISTQANPSNYTMCLLDQYRQSVEAGKSQFYFPLHINGNHWIAFGIDFVQKTFRYGDSFGRKSASKFIPYLEKWLERASFGTFQNLGDNMPHPRQTDYVHCGIYAVNTIEHAVFQTPLISFNDVRPTRMAWFHKFVQQMSDSGPIPFFVNHNFPNLGSQNFFEEDTNPAPSPTVPTLMANSVAITKRSNPVPSSGVACSTIPVSSLELIQPNNLCSAPLDNAALALLSASGSPNSFKAPSRPIKRNVSDHSASGDDDPDNSDNER